nr:ABC transporter substrate-binding protein [uncultured Pseudodesulfovibrio sp.]
MAFHLNKKFFLTVVAILFGMALLFTQESKAVDCPELTGYIGQLPPFNYQDKTGEIHGIAVDALLIISERAGCPILKKKLEFIPFPRAVHDVQYTPSKLVFALAMTPERRDKYQWVGPFDSVSSGLIAKKSRKIRIKSIKDLSKYVVGTIRNSAPADFLHNTLGKGCGQIVSLPTNRQQFEMLELERVDLITQSSIAAPRILAELGMDSDEYEMVYVLRNIQLYYAFSKDVDPVLIKRFNEELVNLKKTSKSGSSEYDSIVKRYVGVGEMSIVE